MMRSFCIYLYNAYMNSRIIALPYPLAPDLAYCTTATPSFKLYKGHVLTHMQL